MKIQINISELQIQDLLITAFDGAYGAVFYWAQPHRDSLKLINSEDFNMDLFKPIKLLDRENKNKEHVISLRDIEEGIGVMAQKYAEHFADIVNDNVDAVTADVFIQCCTFKEVLYG